MGVQVSLNQELYDIGDAIVRTRAIQAFDHAAKAIRSTAWCAAPCAASSRHVFDDLALQMDCADWLARCVRDPSAAAARG